MIKAILIHAALCLLARFSIPRDSPTIANTKSMNPLKSNFLTVVSLTLGIALKVTNTPSIPIGILIKNIQCQVIYSTIQPPKVGPISGPIKPARLIKLMAARNWLRGIILSIAKRPTGNKNAPPIP